MSRSDRPPAGAAKGNQRRSRPPTPGREEATTRMGADTARGRWPIARDSREAGPLERALGARGWAVALDSLSDLLTYKAMVLFERGDAEKALGCLAEAIEATQRQLTRLRAHDANPQTLKALDDLSIRLLLERVCLREWTRAHNRSPLPPGGGLAALRTVNALCEARSLGARDPLVSALVKACEAALRAQRAGRRSAGRAGSRQG